VKKRAVLGGRDVGLVAPGLAFVVVDEQVDGLIGVPALSEQDHPFTGDVVVLVAPDRRGG
jgi:hypothetical protein